MEFIKIEIKKKGLVGKVEFLTISKKLDCYTATFYNIDLIEKIVPEDDLEVNVYLKNYYLMKLNLKILKTLRQMGNMTSFEVDYGTDVFNSFKQGYLNVFKEWSLGREIDWRKLNTYKKKEEWIRCCGIWSGVAENIVLKKEYIIKGEDINSPIDLHCAIGEGLMGNRGYFGFEFNSFIDSLALAIPDNRKNKSKLIFSNFSNMKEKISKVRGYKNYVDEIVEQFMISGFTVSKE